MEIINKLGWIYYLTSNITSLKKDQCGKWMYFFDNKLFISNICKLAIQEDVVVEAKHSDADSGVACFYLNADDLVRHKKVIEFFMRNNLIKRTKTGKFYNLSFKLDNQTRAGEYGTNFKAEIKLDQFIDLYTGGWKVN